MPISYIVDPDTEFIYTVVSGDIEPDEFTAHARRLAEANLLSHPQLIDAQGANLELTTAQVQRLASASKELRKGLTPTQVAFVTERQSLYEMVRIFQMMTRDVNPGFAVFRDLREAIRWVRM